MADDGRLILIGSSIAESLPGPGATLYAASKAALEFCTPIAMDFLSHSAANRAGRRSRRRAA